MKLTEIRYVTHMGMQFKTHWLIQRKKKIDVTSAEAVLKARGIEICDPQTLLRPAVKLEPYTPPNFQVEIKNEECGLTENSPYLFKNSFQPIAGLHQCQLLTNSLVFKDLPEKIQSKLSDVTENDVQVIKEIVLQSHLKDATQDRLPHVLDIHNKPGYRPPRSFGIQIRKKISSLIHKLLLHVNRSSTHDALLHFLEDATTRVTLPHSGKSMHMLHRAKLIACAREPLQPHLTLAEMKQFLPSPMPDIFPLSPFVHSRPEAGLEGSDAFEVPCGRLAPHTAFFGNDHHLFKYDPETFSGSALLYAFSNAAAYAKQKLKATCGDLEHPVTVNVVYTNGQYFQVGCFQLNTLDLTSDSMRNVCWLAPCEKLFDTVQFENAKPVVTEANAKPLAILKALF